MYECPVCAQDPTSHSLKQVNPGIFYTKPAEATKYWDKDGILEHYDGVLGAHEGAWIWIFDADGFSMKHMFDVDVAIGIARLITQKYSMNLQEIQIINPSWIVTMTLHIVRPFLSKRVLNLIQVHQVLKETII
jgi:hypothetical protein